METVHFEVKFSKVDTVDWFAWNSIDLHQLIAFCIDLCYNKSVKIKRTWSGKVNRVRVTGQAKTPVFSRVFGYWYSVLSASDFRRQMAFKRSPVRSRLSPPKRPEIKRFQVSLYIGQCRKETCYSLTILIITVFQTSPWGRRTFLCSCTWMTSSPAEERWIFHRKCLCLKHKRDTGGAFWKKPRTPQKLLYIFKNQVQRKFSK